MAIVERETGSAEPLSVRGEIGAAAGEPRVQIDEAIAAIAARMRALGHEPVEPENPYWNDDLTFEDPDGWRIVLRYVS